MIKNYISIIITIMVCPYLRIEFFVTQQYIGKAIIFRFVNNNGATYKKTHPDMVIDNDRSLVNLYVHFLYFMLTYLNNAFPSLFSFGSCVTYVNFACNVLIIGYFTPIILLWDGSCNGIYKVQGRIISQNYSRFLCVYIWLTFIHLKIPKILFK